MSIGCQRVKWRFTMVSFSLAYWRKKQNIFCKIDTWSSSIWCCRLRRIRRRSPATTRTTVATSSERGNRRRTIGPASSFGGKFWILAGKGECRWRRGRKKNKTKVSDKKFKQKLIKKRIETYESPWSWINYSFACLFSSKRQQRNRK